MNVGENAPPLTGDPGPPVIIMHPNAPGAQLTLEARTGQDRVIVAGGGDDNISVVGNSPVVSNQSMIVADSNNDNITIETGGGNDTIETGDGNDMVTITGSGDNTVSTGDGDDTVNMLGGGNDTVDTGGGNDTVIITGPGDGSVSTGDGNDTITVTGSGTYTIDTGDGEDTLVVETDQGEYTIIDPDGPDLLTPSGDDLLGSIIETELGSEGDEVNSLIFNTLSARLDQMIDTGTYSKLSASIAMSAFSTVINDATEIEDLTDAVEDANNALFAEAADQYTIEDHALPLKKFRSWVLIVTTPVTTVPSSGISCPEMIRKPADFAKFSNPSKKYETTRELTGYNIYRDGTYIGNTSALTYTDENVANGEYLYSVTAVYDEGESDPVDVLVTVDFSNAPSTDITLVTALESVYPNPFNPSTTIKFATSESGHVTIDVYNVKGQRVTTLVDERMDQGNHSIIWNGQDASGKDVTSGIYFSKMRSGKYTATKKMILMK